MFYSPVPRHNVVFGKEELRVVLRHLRGKEFQNLEGDKFEYEAARYFGVAHVVAIDSGRKALALALKGMSFGPGARVLLPEYCFYALVSVVEGLGMIPVFAPIDSRTLALDIDKVEALLGAVDVVVLIQPFGQGINCTALKRMCDEAGVPLIEDASQSTGAVVGGRHVGTLGHVGVFSMVSGKNLHGFGGGMLVTDDGDLAVAARRLLEEEPVADTKTRALFRSNLLRAGLATNFGFAMGPYLGLLLASEFAPSRYEATFHEDRAPYGAETRIYPIAPAQAALARVGLKRLDTRNGIRRRNAEYLFGALAGLEDVLCQEVESQASHTFNAFPLRVPEAASLGRYLLHRGIDIRRDYMTWYTSPRFTDEVVYIPNHPGLSVKKMGYIARTIREFYR